MAVTLSPLESLSWIIITGGLDECFQYWYLHNGWAVPYDFNDVFMDFAGGALGVIFAMAFLRVERRDRQRISFGPATATLAAIVTAGVVLFATGKLLLYKNEALPYWIALSRLRVPGFWFFDETWGPKVFHTLTPVEGPILLLAALGFYAVLDVRLQISPPEDKP
jgi:ABC-type Co2+ transport system permease subunit